MSTTGTSIFERCGRGHLRRLIQETPIIDNHAHPLLRPEALTKHPFESIVSEATGDALSSSWSTLSHMRAVRQLADLHGCEPTWQAVVSASESKRVSGSYNTWIGRCLSGIETVLVDDGLGDPADIHSFSALSAYTQSPCWRIVRIERVVEKAVEQLASRGTCSFDAVVEVFDKELTEAVHDPLVVGFKSVICYRSGLAVPGSIDQLTAKSEFNARLESYIRERQATGSSAPFRLDQALSGQFFVNEAASILRNATVGLPPDADRPPKVFQFHTGLGDNDLTLSKASPSHLQDFIRQYSTVPIVLLHAGYPFTREAAYLAATYANAWVDVGEVFPCLSRRGQETVFHELLEIAPWSKVLVSTDGHYFPETYYLAQTQVREVLETVLCEYVQKGDMTWSAAEDLAIGVLYQNSNKLYKLGLPERHREGSVSGLHEIRAKPSVIDPLQILESYLTKDPSIQYLRVYWSDMTGATRVRATHIDYVRKCLKNTGEFFLGITMASLGLLQNDTLAPGAHPVGQYKVYPDWSRVRMGTRQGHLSTYAEFRESNGSPSLLCPRTSLKRVIQNGEILDLEFLLGFELELILMEHTNSGISRNSQSVGHMWSSSRILDRPIFSVIEKALAYLRIVDIHVEQVHAESAPGQFEIVLPAAPPLEAIDRLLYVREVLAQYASAEGYKMTLHPKPFSFAAGNASHVHMSLRGDKGDDPAVYESFYAGILTHLRSICAFTYSNPASYDRVVDGCWAGGRYVAWGTQNRETPLRKISGSHWELKCLDGIANPYLALAAVLYAGLHGVLKRTVLRWEDCELDPATLTAEERAGLGILEMLPESLPEALEALAEDEVLRTGLGPQLVSRYVAVKGEEVNMLDAMGSSEEARQWVLERY